MCVCVWKPHLYLFPLNLIQFYVCIQIKRCMCRFIIIISFSADTNECLYKLWRQTRVNCIYFSVCVCVCNAYKCIQSSQLLFIFHFLFFLSHVNTLTGCIWKLSTFVVVRNHHWWHISIYLKKGWVVSYWCCTSVCVCLLSASRVFFCKWNMEREENE